MIKPLRKRHLQTWITLAFLLPAGITAAWLAVPKPVKDHLLQPSSTQALPLVLRTFGQRNPFICIRSSADSSSLQLEWVGSTELGYPSALIYQVADSTKDIMDGNIIGRIDMRGAYHFPLKKDPVTKSFYFIVYDIIHHKIIQRINI